MKIQYIKPELDIENIVYESSLLTDSGLTGDSNGETIGDGGGPDDGTHDPDANTITLWDNLEDRF